MSKEPSSTKHTNMFGLSDKEMEQLNKDTIAIIKENQEIDRQILASQKVATPTEKKVSA